MNLVSPIPPLQGVHQHHERENDKTEGSESHASALRTMVILPVSPAQWVRAFRASRMAQ